MIPRLCLTTAQRDAIALHACKEFQPSGEGLFTLEPAFFLRCHLVDSPAFFRLADGSRISGGVSPTQALIYAAGLGAEALAASFFSLS